MEQVQLGIGNYYGDVVAYEENGQFFIELSNWDKPDKKEISREFYEAIKKEFNS